MFNNYIAEFSDYKVDKTAYNSQEAYLKNILTTLTGFGIDKALIQKIIDEKVILGFLKNYKYFIKYSLNALKDGFEQNLMNHIMKIGSRQSTNVKELNLCKSNIKTKENLAICTFVAELKKMINEKKVNINANKILKTTLKE